MDPRVSHEVSITDLFDQFIEASTMRNVLSIYHRILNYSDLDPCEFNVFFPKLKRAVMTNRLRKNWKAKALFSKIDKKAAHRCYSNTKAPTPLGNRCNDNHNNSQEYLDESVSSQSTRTYYNNNALQHYNCLIIGSGPAGLRTAIELQLLGASRVVVVEKRSRFSRNNVLHLWPFVIDDLKSLGAKKFYGKFCAGSIDHISIRQLQLILLKVSLLVGCDFRDSCSYLYLCPESIKQTQQIINGNNSDNKTANGTSDSTENNTLKCDLEPQALCQMEQIFVKVTSDIANKLENSNHKIEARNNVNNNNNSVNDVCQSLDTKQDDQINFDQSTAIENISKTNQLLTDKSIKLPEFKLEKPVRRGENLRGARAHFESEYRLQEKELHSCEWDIIIGADGRRNTLSKFFPRKEFRGRLAIAITANFINRQTPAEASVSEISGLSFIYNQEMFNSLAYDTNIELENICYYKDDTHYFVMTAKKRSLLERKVLINDYAATQDLLSDSNVDRQALLKYAKDAAYWTTGLEPLDFALNHYGQEDCAMFDFTSMYAASNACKALRTKEGGLALVSLVGDSLLEPFWPTGSGCARGFLSSFDAAWMCRQWAVNKCAVIDYHNSISSRSSRNRSPNNSGALNKSLEPTTYNRMALSVMAERESIYRILAQTTSENLHQNFSHWTLNPHTRYPNLNRHLVVPSQVEHLITDNDGKSELTNRDKNRLAPATTERTRRVKSPNNASRKSPKKLKSAMTPPMTQPRNTRGRAKSLVKTTPKFRNRHDTALDDTYLEFEKSYNNLADFETTGTTQYLSHKRPDCDLYDDFFVPSISGTRPSSNNLQHLEARRARDIDECLRQRRQKKQLNVVRDQLVGELRGGRILNDEAPGNNIVAGNAALFNELRKLRELQSNRGKENKPKDVNGSLTLLNSMRRCASFAERVKSFESKLGTSSQELTVPTTPKTPLDSVKNLPHFATLQELFVGSSTLNRDTEPKKSKIPIMKLTKDDWNVKCWEKRLAAHKHKTAVGEGYYGSTKSLNKAVSVESYHTTKPERQVEVFKDRIKEMAEKLKKTRDHNQKHYGETDKNSTEQQQDSYLKSNLRSQGWVSHLRKELIRGSEAKRPQNVTRQAMNPNVPNKPIKKLFEDDDDDDSSDKHYDHLCINRPTNKYLPKNGGYTSHLVRSKYNSATSKVINRPAPTAESKQAYMAALTSRGSSASSTLSDYSTNTGGSSSGSTKQQAEKIKCFRCKESVKSAIDKITIGDSILHRNCLTCAECGITLRTNEIQLYIDQMKDSNSPTTPTRGQDKGNFVCAICQPNIRTSLNMAAASRLAQVETGWSQSHKNGSDFVKRRFQSRADFLNERINYNELYKNILNDSVGKTGNQDVAKTASDNNGRFDSESRELTPTSTSVTHDSESSSRNYVDARSKFDNSLQTPENHRNYVSTSPVTVTLPLELVVGRKKSSATPAVNDDNENGVYRIAKSETIDGSEQVTIILPPPEEPSELAAPATIASATITPDHDPRTGFRSWPPAMIDEDELERLHHDRESGVVSSNNTLGDEKKNNSNDDESSGDKDGENDSMTSDDDENHDDEVRREAAALSEDPSSLNSPPNSEDYDDIDDNIDQNSTYEDFLTSEEFGAPSDAEEEVISLSDSEDDEEVNRSRLQRKVSLSDE